MSQQALDLRQSLQVAWRHRILVGVVAALGFLAGICFTLLNPPMFMSQALVLLSPATHDTRTQIVIASSDPVLENALRRVGAGASLQTLRTHIRADSLAYNIISVSAQGTTADQAEGTANAVASSYVDYLRSGAIPGEAVSARLLAPATDATATPLLLSLFVTGVIGALAGLLIGAIVALAISRSDRHLRGRDEIAESIGMPVLASIPVRHPSDAAGWRKLLAEYEPGAADGWRLRRALGDLDLAAGNGSGSSLTMVSLSSDPKALALGPQLAVFAASLGISTVLVVGPQQDANVAATLRAACIAPPASLKQSGNLQVAVSDHGNTRPPRGAVLTVIVAVVDGKTPKTAGTMRTGATVLGVSAGGVTADQLARVAASFAAGGRHIAGIFVADPDSADQTSGRLPHLALVQRRLPMIPTGTPTETER
jgi:capsular polysaccharide biosynthesis protein